MRDHAYGIFEIMAWPAAVWCASELVLRTLVREPAGLARTAVIGAMAATTIVCCRWRRGSLARA